MKRPDQEECYLTGFRIGNFHRHLENAARSKKMAEASRSLMKASGEAAAIPTGVKG